MTTKGTTTEIGLDHASLAMLASVVFVEICFCIDYHQQRWETMIAPLHQPAAKAGEAWVIQSNGLGYYAWLRSVLVDGDWDFTNEFDEHNPLGQYVPPPTYQTPLGRRANQWSVGPACLWAIAVVPLHFFLKLGEGTFFGWATDGYSLPYQLAVAAMTLLGTSVGLGFLYAVCRLFASPISAALAVAWLTLGTTLFYFNAIEISLPHGPAAAVMACFVWYWVKSYGQSRHGRWLLVGVLLGIAALMRWQLATYAVLPAGEAALAGLHLCLKGELRKLIQPFGSLALAALGTMIAFTPQIVAWRCVYGNWLALPIQGIRFHWLTPSLWDVLLSQDRSLFYWTPLALIAFLGLFLGVLRGLLRNSEARASVEPLILLFVGFLMQVYALAAMWGQGEYLTKTENSAGVFLARSFGFRDLTESLVILVPGLALLLDQIRAHRFQLIRPLAACLIIWNLLLVEGYVSGELPQMSGADFRTLLTKTANVISNEPSMLLLAFMGPVLIEMVLLADRWTAKRVDC